MAFFWAPKFAMAKIEETLELNDAGTAKLVYIALCRIANNEDTGSFTKPIQYLATIASVSRSTVKRRLADLEEMGLIRIERFPLRQASRYTVVLFPDGYRWQGANDGSQRANDGSRTMCKHS